MSLMPVSTQRDNPSPFSDPLDRSSGRSIEDGFSRFAHTDEQTSVNSNNIINFAMPFRGDAVEYATLMQKSEELFQTKIEELRLKEKEELRLQKYIGELILENKKLRQTMEEHVRNAGFGDELLCDIPTLGDDITYSPYGSIIEVQNRIITSLDCKNLGLRLHIDEVAHYTKFSDKLLGYIRSGNQPMISSVLMKLDDDFKPRLYNHLWEVCGSPKLPEQMGRSPLEKWGYCAFVDGSVEGYRATVEQKEKALLAFKRQLFTEPY